MFLNKAHSVSSESERPASTKGGSGGSGELGLLTRPRLGSRPHLRARMMFLKPHLWLPYASSAFLKAATLTAPNILFKNNYIFVCECMCVGMGTSQLLCRSQRTTRKEQFSSTMWLLGNEVKLSDSVPGALPTSSLNQISQEKLQ